MSRGGRAGEEQREQEEDGSHPHALTLGDASRQELPDTEPGGRLLETVLAGWIGTDAGITPDALRLGISGVYFESETHTFAIIGFDFKTEKDAMTAEKSLSDRFAGKTEHRFVRKGTYVVVFALPSPTNNACAQWMWEELGRRLDKVAT